ncbi:MAG: homoaconitase [Deltaproteobacteria bacterium]|nr:homoaconitase [Deltaproteobacteria bacterium]
MAQTIVEKIAQASLSGAKEAAPQRELKAGDFVSLQPHRVMTHDNSAAVLNKFEAIGASKLANAEQVVFTLDHDIQNRSEANLAKYARIEAFAKAQGSAFYPAGSGIGHQRMVEDGHVLPGTVCVASDSHSNMYGALGALGTPVVRTDAAAIWATGEFWWVIPHTVQVVLTGRLRPGVSGKDVILTLCGLYNQGEALNAAVEFSGEGVASLSMDARLSIANMTTEWGALVGWFPVDEVTLAFFEGRRAAGVTRVREEQLAAWRQDPPRPDAGAHYAARIELDLSGVTPQLAGPDVVQKVTSLAEMASRQVKVHKAYLLSCVNSRSEDLQAAAHVLKGKHVAEGVTLYVAAASGEIEARAREEGSWKIFEEAGATFLPPSCGPCIGLGQGLLEAGEVGISATNRNFKGRMGSAEAACYLASPEVVAASAVAGVIAGPAFSTDALERCYEVFDAARAETQEATEILEGFPTQLEGRLVYLPADNLNTDGIYGKDYTYREDMTREQMAAVVMENYDPSFAERVCEGDVIVSGKNFGTGSSREQAVTALQAKGVPLVIAASFSQTYLRNAFNNGFLCLELPELCAALQERYGDREQKTIIDEEMISVDFAAGELCLNDTIYRFTSPSRVAQELVVVGGIERLVQQKLVAGVG